VGFEPKSLLWGNWSGVTGSGVGLIIRLPINLLITWFVRSLAHITSNVLGSFVRLVLRWHLPYVAQAGLELMILLPQPPEYCHFTGV
jgi:hypothetical protein